MRTPTGPTLPEDKTSSNDAAFGTEQSCGAGGCGVRERFAFTSLLALGALFALSASPCSGMPYPLFSILVIVGVPLMTFSVAAPSRLGMFSEMGLLWRGLQSLGLRALLMVLGRRQDATTVKNTFDREVEMTYRASSWRINDAIDSDPARLHHARRLATFATLLAVFGGLSLPYVHPADFTFGSGFEGMLVFGFDLLVFAVVGRMVAERILIRLFEAGVALGGVSAEGGPRIRITPLTTLLGAALGAVGALVVVSAGAVACGIETSMLDSSSGLHEAAFWFIRKVSPMGLPIGIAAGAILGVGMGVSHPADDDDDDA